MVEQDCIDGLYHSLGVSVGGEFSSEDVSVIFQRVFQYPSTADEVHVAMKKVSGEGEGWYCVGEKVLDVLLEMEKERERKEELYWAQKVLNVGIANNLFIKNTEDIIHHHQVPDVLNCHSDPPTFKQVQNTFDKGTLPCGSDDVCIPQRDGGRRCVMQLKRRARQSWARLVAEGVHSVLPARWRGPELKVRGQALGCLTPSDLLLLVEVKYDVVARALYTEMLQEHYGLTEWETLLPWQQDKETEELEDLAELAFGSGDLLPVTELPGAFRIYKTRGGALLEGTPDSGRESWSALAVLPEVHAARQQERDSLARLSERLDRENMRLLFLYIRLATFRAQTEQMSYGALLAARQSWESWPVVCNAYVNEQASQWLQGDDEVEQKDLFIAASPQQAVLQWLVLKQKAEREYLLGLLRGVSLEQLQGQKSHSLLKDEEKQSQGSLKDGCLKRLRQIRADLQTDATSEVHQHQKNSSQSHPRSRFQPSQTRASTQPRTQDQNHAHGSWSQCAVLLLRQLTELQESQVSAVLPALLPMSVERLQALRDEYQSEFQGQHFDNLPQLLGSDPAESSLIDGIATSQICPSGPITEWNNGIDHFQLQNKSTAEPIQIAVTTGPAQATDAFQRQDLCRGCGAALEELPYLEILCIPDTTNASHEGHPATEGPHDEEEQEVGPGGTSQSSEKQGSLITSAWSEPAQNEDDNDCQEEAAPGDAPECSVELVGEASDGHSLAGQAHYEMAPDRVSHVEVLDESEARTDRHVQLNKAAVQTPMGSMEERRVSQQPAETKEALRGSNLRPLHLVTETREIVPVPPSAPSAETTRHNQDVCSEQNRATASARRFPAEAGKQAEARPTKVHPGPWDQSQPEGHEHTPQTTVVDITEEATLEATLRACNSTDPVSLLERESTMRNLVDMQRKVERKQKRARERQLLRVRERLSIIQNRKAEEDLLGLKQRETLQHLTHNLPQEDKVQQKTVVRARLEQLRRERSNVMQSKRERNTAGFKELLGPLEHGTDTENGADQLVPNTCLHVSGSQTSQ